MERLQEDVEPVGGCDRPYEDTEGETVGGPAAPGERERTDVIRNVIRGVDLLLHHGVFVKPARIRLAQNNLFIFSERQQHMDIQSYGHCIAH